MIDPKYKKILIVFSIIFIIFAVDRVSKIYLLNLSEIGIKIDFYILPVLNIFLVWNTGIGFGLFSNDPNIWYHSLTLLIGVINLILLFLIFKIKDIRKYFISVVLGGSIGNFFDRVYYFAVPDFLDLHIGDFHWFIFNIADIFISLGIMGLILFEFINKYKDKKNV